MEDMLSLMRSRRSVRSYSSKPVPRELVTQCLEASRLAPSACNSQPWYFVIADEQGLLEELRSCAVHRGMNRFAKQAPVIAALFSRGSSLPAKFGSMVKGTAYDLIDIGIAAEHFCLAAADAGLGTCMIGWFDKKRAAEAAGVPRTMKPLLLITLGYPAEDTVREKRRKDLDDISGWNGFGKG